MTQALLLRGRSIRIVLVEVIPSRFQSQLRCPYQSISVHPILQHPSPRSVLFHLHHLTHSLDGCRHALSLRINISLHLDPASRATILALLLASYLHTHRYHVGTLPLHATDPSLLTATTLVVCRHISTRADQGMPKKHTKAPSTTGDHTRTSKKASRPPSPKPCADNEVRYASPGAAKRAFRMERESNPKYRRCPTPHVSQSRRVGSHASLGTAFTGGESGSGGSGNLSAETVTPFTGGLERYDPNDNVEIISGPLGRKEPKHRTLLPGMLRPALRSATRLPQDFRPPPPPNASKPLPSRPMSVINSGFDSLMRMTSRSAPLTRSQSRSSIYPSPSVDQRANPISNLFSSLSLGTPSPRYHRSRELITPADNLNDYLRLSSVPTWDRWPEGADDSKWAMFGGGSSNAAWKNTGVGWEWMRRLEDSEKERMRGRALKIREGPDRYWEKEIIDCEVS